MKFNKFYYRIVKLKLYKTYILPPCEAKYLSATGLIVPDFALSGGDHNAHCSGGCRAGLLHKDRSHYFVLASFMREVDIEASTTSPPLLPS
eukprot:scaffold10953_cov108-Skeletonema_dohrnii-CCMP3373.AAC.2